MVVGALLLPLLVVRSADPYFPLARLQAVPDLPGAVAGDRPASESLVGEILATGDMTFLLTLYRFTLCPFLRARPFGLGHPPALGSVAHVTESPRWFITLTLMQHA